MAASRLYIQANPPATVGWLLFDVDLDAGRNGAAALFSWEEANLPPPSLAVATRLPAGGLGGCHLAWALEEPVARGPNARSRPLAYLSAIERAMTHQLGADPGYARLITKNPLHPARHVTSFTRTLYSLRGLAARCDFEASPPRACPAATAGLGRNCTTFECARRWAYANVSTYRGGSEARWRDAVTAELFRINVTFAAPLPEREVVASAKSIATWVWRRYTGRGGSRPNRGVLAEVVDGLTLEERRAAGGRYVASRRADRTLELLAASAGELASRLGRAPTQAEVARASGISLRTVKRGWAGFCAPAALQAAA